MFYPLVFSCCFLPVSPQKIAPIVNKRMNKPPTAASIGTTILFFFFSSHESEPQRLEFSPTLPTTGLLATILSKRTLKL